MSLELEDHPWFPAWMRRHQMAFLSFMALRFHLYQPVAPLVRQMLEEEASGAWTDCCTGAAGPVQYMLQQGCRPAQLLLTDKYPIGTNIFSHEVSARWEAVDVLQDAIPGQGLITFFNAFHHFTTAQRQQLLTQIAATKRPLLIAEITQPTVPCWMLVNLSTTLGQILFAPSAGGACSSRTWCRCIWLRLPGTAAYPCFVPSAGDPLNGCVWILPPLNIASAFSKAGRGGEKFLS
jgi:hypothetical protein